MLIYIARKEGIVMPINNGMNSDYVCYFPLEEYVDRIVLLPRILEHLEETNRSFKDYIKKLSCYDEDYIVDYWIYLLYEELMYNQKIEHPSRIDYKRIDLLNDDVFFDTLTISNKRIHELHNFAVKGEYEPSFEYRKADVNVSRFRDDGTEEIFWRGANYQDVEKFMNDFIKIYKHNDISLLMSNPFLKSSLIQLLFLRIHPYADGNGRTARLLHNSKFTESINKIYGTRLKISPLNLSHSILVNKITYIKAIDNIYFDIKHDSNDAINHWFDIMLNMADEQIYSSTEKLENISPERLREVQNVNDEDIINYVNRKMKVKSLGK